MHHGHSDNSVVNTWGGRVRGTDREVVPADEDEVWMVDVEVQPFAGNEAQRPKRSLSKPGLNIFDSSLEVLFRVF